MTAGTGTFSYPAAVIDGDPMAVDPDELEGHERAKAWAARLIAQLDERAPRIDELRNYRHGDHPIRFATEEWRETFGDDFGLAIDNWCGLIVEAAVERMAVQGFRFGGAEAGDDQAPDGQVGDGDRADDEAWGIWQRNLLDLNSDLVHDEAVSTGYSYVLTWPGDDDEPLISVEDPLHAIVEMDPQNRKRRLAGLKRWKGLDGRWRAQVWTPDMTWQLKAGDEQAWEVTDEEENDAGLVPLVPFVNQPDIYGCGHGDPEPILPLQDITNKLFSDMTIASEFAAFSQRVLIGAEVPTDPRTGRPAESLRGGIARWIGIEMDLGDGSEDPVMLPKIQELSAADLSNYTKPIEVIVHHIAAQTKTPPHYILGAIVNVSAEALKAAEASLVARVKRKMRLFGESWEEVLRIAFLLKGDEERGRDHGAEVIWGDPETISEAQRVDALAKLGSDAIGLPKRAIWEMIPGATPLRLKRWDGMARRQALDMGLSLGVAPNGPSVEPPPQGPTPVTAATDER